MENLTVTRMTCSPLMAISVPDRTNESSEMAAIFKGQTQCQLNDFLVSFSPFINLVKGLLHYGTIIIVVMGLLLNSLSFVVLTRKGMRKSILSIFLSVLAVYDTLSLTLNFMIGANKWFQDNEHLCKLHGVFVQVFNLLSVWTIVTFTLQRYFVIKFPIKSKSFTVQKTAIVLATVSVAVVVFCCHKIFVTGFEGDSVFGFKGCHTNRVQVPAISYFYVAFNTWFPTILITVFNCAMIWELKKQQVKRQQLTNTVSKAEKKATKLLLTVSFTYLVLILPLGIVQTIELFWNARVKLLFPGHALYVPSMIVKHKLKWVRAFFFFFYQINFAVNFFLFVFSSSGVRFRYTLWRVFGIKAQQPISETDFSFVAGSNSVAPTQSTAITANSM